MITLTGNPISTQHAYLQRGKMRFMKKDAVKQKAKWNVEALRQWTDNPLSESISIIIRIYFGDKRKRDWDNYHKLSMDALAGVVWEDDVQIQSATVEKHYDKENPRIEIEII